MIWTEEENEIRQLDNMFNSKGKSCKSCNWCNWEKGQDFFTCGHHIENFTPNSFCTYWTDPKDPKLLAYFEERKKELKIKLKKNQSNN